MPSLEDSESRLLNSIQNLQNLLTILVGLALAMAVSAILDSELGTPPHAKVLLGMAFLFTVTPFYHGALLHLFAARTSAALKSVHFMLDYFMLLMESCLILLLGSLAGRPDLFFWCLVALLLFDSGWGFAFHRMETAGAEKTWGILNIGTVALLMSVFWRGSITVDALTSAWGVPVLAGLLLLRTVADYALCRRSYFLDRSTP